MTEVKRNDVDHSAFQLDERHVQALRDKLRGPLLTPGDEGYDGARQVWNGMIDRHPALIARCAGTADVIDCVRFARQHALELSVRGGAHNVAGLAVTEGGLMLDLSLLRGAHVESSERRVRVQPGATWGDVDRETQAFGLVVPGGIVSTTGVAGFTLGGGFGWASRTFGLACDSLRSAQLVTADGECIRASRDETPDLFWGLKGGSGNFGVVTSFEFDAHPLGPQVAAGIVLHPFDDGGKVMAMFREITENAPRKLCTLLVLRCAPPAPFVPENWHGKLVAAIAVCYCGDVEEGMRAAKHIKDFGSPIADVVTPKPFLAHQKMLDAGAPFGRRYYWKTHFFDTLTAETDEAMLEHAAKITSPHSAVLLMHMGGAISDLDEHETAYGNRSARYILNIQGAWDSSKEDEAGVAWARDYWAAVDPYASGGMYANFMTEDEMDERLERAYRSKKIKRLERLKARFDPDNFFHLNHNVSPDPGGC